MEQAVSEFKHKTTGEGRKIKITNSFGVYDVYKLMRKNHWFDMFKTVSQKDYYAIIRGVNKLLAENIALGGTVTFPDKMGKIELRKHPAGVRLKDGKLKNNYPINWADTWKLWYSDPDERAKKTLLRYEVPFVYYTSYNKHDATYENKVFYQFVLNRFIKKALNENIKNGKTDTLW